MAITVFRPNKPTVVSDDPIAKALLTLQNEETALNSQLSELQTRLSQVRQAISAMKPLVRSAFAEQLQRPSVDEEEELGEEGNPYSGMKFSQALKQFLDGVPGWLSTTEIAKQFEESGWTFAQKDQSAKVNQIGVTLRRFRDKYFERNDDGGWRAIPG